MRIKLTIWFPNPSFHHNHSFTFLIKNASSFFISMLSMLFNNIKNFQFEQNLHLALLSQKLKHSNYFFPPRNLILLFPRKSFIEELGKGYHLIPCSSKNVPFSLGKLFLRKLGRSYHLVPFSQGNYSPRQWTWRSFLKVISFSIHFACGRNGKFGKRNCWVERGILAIPSLFFFVNIVQEE